MRLNNMVIRKDKPFISKINLKLIWLTRALGTQFKIYAQKIGVFAANKLRKVVYKKTIAIGTKLKSYIQKAPTIAGNSIKKTYKITHIFADSEIARKHKLLAKKSSYEIDMETREARQPTQHIQQLSSEVGACGENVNFSSQHQELDVIPSECLMCEELVRCVHRQNKTYCSGVQTRTANKH